ncbi:ABC transporter permease [Spiroplasma endosymbiont of Anurida maritima]|uniref:FtsX-like permease family protein n=1 Tax=Spiroplasma endosymbiont of Anurida maritima TaxID=2967972 RepID=UPI0036D3508D
MKLKKNEIQNKSGEWDYYFNNEVDAVFKETFLEPEPFMNYYINNNYIVDDFLLKSDDVNINSERYLDDQVVEVLSLLEKLRLDQPEDYTEDVRNDYKISEVFFNILKNENFEYWENYLKTYNNTNKFKLSFSTALNYWNKNKNTNYFMTYENDQNYSNKILLQHGSLPTTNNEVVINYKYATSNNLNIGDMIFIDHINEYFKISGIGNPLNNIAPKLSLQTNFSLNLANVADYFFANNLYMSFSHDKYNELYLQHFNNDSLLQNTKNMDEIFITNLTNVDSYEFAKEEEYWSIIPYSKSFFVNTLNTFNLLTVIYAALFFILIFLIIFFMHFIIKKELNNTKKQIAVFKAFGYNEILLALAFSIKYFIIVTIGTLLGMGLGLPFQIFANNLYFKFLELPIIPLYFDLRMILIIFVVVPTLVFTAGFLYNIFYFKKSHHSLIMSTQENFKPKKNNLYKNYKKKKLKHFLFKLNFKNFTLNKGKFFGVFAVFFFASFILLFTLSATNVIDSMSKTINSDYKSDVNWLQHHGEKSDEILNEKNENKLVLKNLQNTVFLEKNADYLKDQENEIQEFKNIVMEINAEYLKWKKVK